MNSVHACTSHANYLKTEDFCTCIGKSHPMIFFCCPIYSIHRINAYHCFLSAMLLSFMSLVVGCAGEMNPTFLAEQVLFLNWVNMDGVQAGFSVI